MTELPKRALGRTGLEVTTLGYGAMELRGAPSGPQISDDAADRILNAVLDAGINFIDTSIDYGRSEELIGRFIPHRRSEYFLASKCGCVPGAAMGAEHIHTAANIRAGGREQSALSRCRIRPRPKPRTTAQEAWRPIHRRRGHEYLLLRERESWRCLRTQVAQI